MNGEEFPNQEDWAKLACAVARALIGVPTLELQHMQSVSHVKGASTSELRSRAYHMGDELLGEAKLLCQEIGVRHSPAVHNSAGLRVGICRHPQRLE